MIVAIEAILQSKRVHNLEFSPHDNSRGAHFTGFDLKAARLQIYIHGPFGEKPWKKPYLGPGSESGTFMCHITAIEKRVFLFAVAMNITVDRYLLILQVCYFVHELFRMVHLGMEF